MTNSENLCKQIANVFERNRQVKMVERGSAHGVGTQNTTVDSNRRMLMNGTHYIHRGAGWVRQSQTRFIITSGLICRN